MKTTTIIILALIVSANVFGQSKPRKVTIKKSVTISKDSAYYLPDTIACIFKELIITKDSVFEKWQHGYVVWQVWNDNYWGGFASIGSGNVIFRGTVNNEPYKIDYDFSRAMHGKFLYSDYEPVNNTVTQAYKPTQ